MKIRSLILTAAIFAIGAAGCTPITQNTYERDKPVAAAQFIKDKRIETDPVLTGTIHLTEIRKAVVQEDLLKIDVELFNSDTSEADFDYKFEWFDDQATLVDSPSSTWDSQHIAGGEALSLVAIAPNNRCKDFRLKIQRSQRG